MSRLPYIIAAWLVAASLGCRPSGLPDTPEPEPTVIPSAREHPRPTDAGADSTPLDRPITEAEAIEAVRALPDVKELQAAYGEAPEAGLKIELVDRDENVFTIRVNVAASGGRTVTHGIYEVDRKSGEVIKVEF